MKIVWILCLMITSFNLNAASEIEVAKNSLKGLIEPILQKPSSKGQQKSEISFTVEECEKHQINWIDVLLLRQSTSLNYHFKKGCDIEGSIKPKVLSPFPVVLKLKNLEDFYLLEAQNKITAGLEDKPILYLTIREATLTGKKGKIGFEADYAVRINPLKKENTIEENLGGELRVLSIYGKKVSIKEKILIE